ncbi:MAG: hypothetical protein QM764_08860 [Chitinophagaceae bacterium]
MKILFYSLLSFAMFFQNNKAKNMNKKVVYEHKEFSASYSIELEWKNDSIIGTYYGSEVDSRGELIYYRSDFSYHGKKDGSSGIYFVLKNYDFSFKSFQKNKENNDLIKDLSAISPILTGQQIFQGKFYGEVLEMKRTRRFSDSAFDIMIFLKKGYEKQKANIGW